MAIALDNTSNSAAQSNTTGYSWNHTVAGSDRMLVVGIVMQDTTDADRTVTGVTYNGVAMSLAKEQDNNADDISASLWYLANPATGTNSISCTLNGTVSNSIGMAVSLTGVDPGAPDDNNGANASNANSVSTTVNSTVNDSWAVDVMCTASSATIVVGADQTQRVNGGTGGFITASRMSTEAKATAGTITMSWDDTSIFTPDFVIAAAVFAPKQSNFFHYTSIANTVRTERFYYTSQAQLARDELKTFYTSIANTSQLARKFHYTGKANVVRFERFYYTSKGSVSQTVRSYYSSQGWVKDPTKYYTKESLLNQPTTDSDLALELTPSEYNALRDNDNVYATLQMKEDDNVFLFKRQNINNTDTIVISLIAKSEVAPSSSQALLQIYNQDSDSWETLDSDNTTSANTEFTLEGVVDTNVANYYATDNWVSFRLYQERP